MKTIILQLMLLLSGITALQAQDVITIKHSCSFDEEETDHEFYYFGASSEADRIVEQIVDAVSLSKNFVVKSSDCKNALATVSGGKRFILYNTSFMEKFKKDARTKWAAYCVLAHEIGHHLNGHDFETTDSKLRKKMELQADVFAGGVLHKLGASLDDAKAGIELLQNKGETETHPPARARAEAIANGWKKSEENTKKINTGNDTSNSTPVENDDNGEKIELTPPDELFGNKSKSNPTTESNTNLTAVSDQLIFNKLIGSWNIDMGLNAFGQRTIVQSTLYSDGSMYTQTWINGIPNNPVITSWMVYNNTFVNVDQAGYYYYYSPSFNGDNNLVLTFTGSSVIVNYPVGSTFYYTRAQ